MTARTRALFGMLLFLGASLTGARACAQDVDAGGPDAAQVASWVQTFYDQTTSLEADFQQFFWTRVYDRTDSSRGQLRIARPGRIRFDYSEPSHKIIVGS